jgi:pimeloyl-ACP methyl ester carboxylesterase
MHRKPDILLAARHPGNINCTQVVKRRLLVHTGGLCIPCLLTLQRRENTVKTRFRVVITLVLLGFVYIMFVAIPREAIKEQRNPLTGTPADVGLVFEDFVITPQDTELTLAGWWMPVQNARATLVFIHGAGSNRNSSYFGSLKFYRALVDQGVAMATIDLRNHGDSGSDGQGLQFGRTEKHDAAAAIAWARAKTPDLPLFAMGTSMGGATLIQAAHDGAKLDGLILLDSLLDTHDAFKQGAWVETGLPPALFSLSAWALTQFFGLPGGEDQALERAVSLDLPILAIQDAADPVTRLRYARELAQRNPRVTLWTAPAIDPQHPDLAWKQRWSSHVAAFEFYPSETVGHIMTFINSTPSATNGNSALAYDRQASTGQ